MFRPFDNRSGHYLLLTLVWALLCLPNLGTPGLWDIDEGNNMTAALEMRESGNYVIPTFNGRLREDKPPLLYWLQIAAMSVCGVNEWAARLPSALAALLSVLACYELGRRMFGAAAGLLAGLVLAGAVLFSAAAHFANPDALLTALTLLTLLLFWDGYARGAGGWLIAGGVTTGLAVLAKGPVGLVPPAAVIFLFLLWQRRLRLYRDPRLLLGVLAFVVVALPWYAWIGVETKGEWLRGFFLRHNLDRALGAPMENHRGPIYYYVLVLVAGFVPWSVIFGPAVWDAASDWRGVRRAESGAAGDPRPALRFLVCWIGVYFVLFSAASTKLPNYILPLYPAVALLLARFLDRWRRGAVRPAAWVVNVSLACLALIGVGVGVGLLVGGGVIELAALRGRSFPGLENLTWLGALHVVGAGAAWLLARRQRWAGLVGALAVTSVLFTGSVFAWGTLVVDRYKAPRALALSLPADQTRREVRVAAYAYFQPSVVFYCRREVPRLDEEYQAVEFLRTPLPCYLFVPARRWDEMRARMPAPARVLARHYDLYDGGEIVVVSNEQEALARRR